MSVTDVKRFLKKYQTYIILVLGIVVILSIAGVLWYLQTVTPPTIQTGNPSQGYTITRGDETVTVKVRGKLIINSTPQEQRLQIVFKRYVLYVNDSPCYFLIYQLEVNITFQNMGNFKITLVPKFKDTKLDIEVTLGLEYDEPVPEGNQIVKTYTLYVSSAYNFVHTIYGGFSDDWNDTQGLFQTDVYFSCKGSLSGLSYSLQFTGGDVSVTLYYKVELIIIQLAIIIFAFSLAVAFLILKRAVK